MSNEEIIVKSAISAGIFSEEEAAAYIMNGLRLPIHTFSEWKNHGYMVKKGRTRRADREHLEAQDPQAEEGRKERGSGQGGKQRVLPHDRLPVHKAAGGSNQARIIATECRLRAVGAIRRHNYEQKQTSR